MTLQHSGMPGGKAGKDERSVEQREQDRTILSQLMRRGYTRQQAAEKLGITLAAIDTDWKVLMRRMRKGMDKDVEALVGAKLEEYAEVKREAWEAWEASKQQIVTRTVEESSSGATEDGVSMGRSNGHVKGGRGALGKVLANSDAQQDSAARPAKRVKTITTTEPRLPDPSYLTKILDCIKAERELLGINPAKKIDMQATMVWDLFAGMKTAVQVLNGQPAPLPGGEVVDGVPQLTSDDDLEAQILAVLGDNEMPTDANVGSTSIKREQDFGV